MRHYLNAPEALSQAWLDHVLLFLILAIFKIYLFAKTLSTMITVVRDAATPLCLSLESLSEKVEQAPSQMTQMTVSVLSSLSNNSVALIDKSIYLCSEAASGLVSLVLELYLGTFTCLLTAVLKGFLDYLTDILYDITEDVQDAINSVLKAFEKALSGLSTAINTIISVVETVESLFTSSDTSDVTESLNTVNLTISNLTSISIPTSWINSVDSLSSDIPDFEDLLSNISSLLTAPITDLASDFSNTSFSLDLATPSVSEKLSSASSSSSSSSCSSLKQALNDTKSKISSLTTYIIIGLSIACVAYAILRCILCLYHLRKQAVVFETLSTLDNAVEIGNLIEQCNLGFFGSFTTSWPSEIKWLVSFTCSPNLLGFLSLGFTGLLVVLLQFLVLKEAEKITTNISASSFASTISNSSSDSFESFVSSAQTSLNDLTTEINDKLLSSINNASSSILSDIDLFETTVNDTINAVFGSSFLASPLRTIIYCTVGRKIEDIEDGLEWIEENTYFEAPSLDQASLKHYFNELVDSSLSSDSSVSEAVSSALQTMLSSCRTALIDELLLACSFIAIWVAYFLIGILILTIQRFRHQTENEMPRPQTISWPYQLSPVAHKEYGFHYNNPYSTISEQVVKMRHSTNSSLLSVQGISRESKTSTCCSQHECECELRSEFTGKSYSSSSPNIHLQLRQAHTSDP